MKHNKRGFTLIELLVVVLIIGILAAIALPKYEKAVHKSRMAEAYPVVRSMWQACELLALEQGKSLPTNGCHLQFDNAGIDIPGTSNYPNSLRETKNFIYQANGESAPFPCAFYKYTKNANSLCFYVDYSSKELKCGYKEGDTEAQSLCKISGLPSVQEPMTCF